MIGPTAVRARVTVKGIVQGVGFRPFVCRLARSLGLTGWVGNYPSGALLEVEGPPVRIEVFLERVRTERPATSRIDDMAVHPLPLQGETAFVIRTSAEEGAKRVVIPPDLATCADCLCELRDPRDRRYRYPFLTCTQCGPRFSLIRDIPYDRANTTMSRFPLCRDCRAEYEDHTNRRFHAEAIACPACGPQLWLWYANGDVIAQREDAISQACALIRQGGIVAVKGIGGFHLWADAASETAVRRLRERKVRPEKPLAVMFPSLDAVRACCDLSLEEEQWLASPQAPIVLAHRKTGGMLAESVAPGNPLIGAILPSAPLHHLLMAELQHPVVATSGNLSEEPIVFDEAEALRRLGGLADAFLVHDRPIARPVDDSVVRVFPCGSEAKGERRGEEPKTNVIILRRARGFVPQTITLSEEVCQGRTDAPILAVGGHLKNTIALLAGNQVLMSQHLGDLGTVEAGAVFRRAVEDLQRLVGVKPSMVACDRHPDYWSTSFARALAESFGVPLVQVQHHHAHVAACMAEHNLDGEVLGVAWDGAGYGSDGTIWGGEWLRATYQGFRRVAHLRPFRLPGGEQAAREPRRCALALLWETFGADALDLASAEHDDRLEQRLVLTAMLQRQINSPVTTSVGRLFDAVASITGFCHAATFEGQAAMAIEWAAMRGRSSGSGGEADYPLPLHREDGEEGPWIADWRPMIRTMVDEVQGGMAPERMACRFHVTLAELIAQVAEQVGLPRVVLTGGCFQNGLLLSLARRGLEEAGFTVYSHRLVPPNDGGLSLGQAVVVAMRGQI